MRFSFSPDRPFRDLAHSVESLLHGKLWLQALVALVAGITVGLLLGPDVGVVDSDSVKTITDWMALPGEVFLRLIKMVLLPLLVASIIRGIGATDDVDKLKKLGIRFFIYVICTSTLAATVGISIARLIRPGAYVSFAHSVAPAASQLPPDNIDIIGDLPMALVNLIPENLIETALNWEMLSIVVFAIIVGIACATQRSEKLRPLLSLLDGVLEVCMIIVRWAMLLVPFAVFGLVARMVAQVGVATLLGLGVYVVTVLLGLAIVFLFYVLLIALFGHISPIEFFKKIAPVQLVAFSTSSSAAVMPLSIRTAVEELDVDEEAAKIIIPLGATVNMDGTALYQSVAIVFLAQMSGIDLSIVQMVMVVATLVLSSIGAPGTPGVGMLILGSVAVNFGIPTTGLALILGVDRILDMSRTALNVTGDLTACVLFGRKTGAMMRWWKMITGSDARPGEDLVKTD